MYSPSPGLLHTLPGALENWGPGRGRSQSMAMRKPVPHKEAISASSLKCKFSFWGLETAHAMRYQVQNELPRTWPQVQEMSLGRNHHLLSSGRRV